MKRILSAVVVLVALALGGVFAYAWWSDDNAPEELGLEDRPAGDDGTEADAASAALEGEWTVAAGSEAGYRVVEDFVGGLANAEAVGRTDQVEGSLTIEGTTVTTTAFTVDMASVASDRSRRDDQFRGRIMSVEEFPTAAFETAAPIELGSLPEAGETISVPVVGTLTLRGQTNDVELTVEARMDGGQIAVAGQIPVVFADYGIPDPSNPIVSTRDNGVVEFLLVFDPAA